MPRRPPPLKQLPEHDAAAYVRQLFSYDKDLGLLTWNVARRGGYATPGAEAGSLDHRGHVVVRIDGHRYAASRLIHLMMLGYWPTHPCDFIDGKPGNLRWRNMHFEGKRLRNTRTARYLRRLRKLNQEAERRIQANPGMRQAYYSSNLEGRRIRAEVRREILAEQQRYLSDDETEEFGNRPGPRRR